MRQRGREWRGDQMMAARGQKEERAGGGRGGDTDIPLQSLTQFLIHEWGPKLTAVYESWS